ncbi:uncharacterized protein TM35_000241240 [Trypanosoma theileri]|uniref:Uncharacterized protein n=1 Tax=Trypanosoma theileri TaxID=67003 RepID=A0A1X0NQK6_9TRYP|nr:uncharacterized protein TM35_000241240 [Trypanosoma theileri]ORC86974.1 hypothetical protein TM35_000241240 [Trypanosoma theileri]
MDGATFDELVLQWVENLQGISREERCRVLERTCDSLQSQNSESLLVLKARDLLHTVRAATDVKVLRQVAALLAKEDAATIIEKHLAPYCTLTLRHGQGTLLRITAAPNVAVNLAAQNASAIKEWKYAGEPQTWCAARSPCSVGVRTVFTDDKEDVVVSFHDEIVFDACDHVYEIERTFLISASSNVDTVLTALQLVNPSSI